MSQPPSPDPRRSSSKPKFKPQKTLQKSMSKILLVSDLTSKLIDAEGFTSGESEDDPKRPSCLNPDLLPQEKEALIIKLWQQCYKKAYGSVYLVSIFNKLHQKVVKFGSTKNLNRKKDTLIQKLLTKKLWFILMPDGQFKKYWNIVMIFLLLYVAILMPYNVCFHQVVPDAGMSNQDYFDFAVDLLFGVDIIVNFISAYEDDATGIPVINPKVISNNYVSSWFLFDLIAIIPFSLLEQFNSKGSQLTRLVRLPRLYKLLRIMRMIKMLRLVRKQAEFNKWFEKLNISVGLSRLLKTLAVQFFLIHLMSCAWFFAATFEENLYNTWVGERDIVDETPLYQYFNSFYWAFQTVTTVGYGDFTIQTGTEYFLALIWMIVGTNLYAFTIGNVSTMIATLDQEEAEFNKQLGVITEFADRIQLPGDIRTRMKIHFENQYKTNNNNEDWEAMFYKFPPQLRSDIVKVTHGTIISTIKFFQNRRQDFLIRLIPKLKLNSYFDNDIVYSQGDQAEEIFFLFHGEVLFYKDVSDIIDMREVVRMESAFNIPFASYSTGSYFGDNDTIVNKNGQRAYTCVCQQDSQLYSVKTPVLDEILLRYKSIKNLMTQIAGEKQNYYNIITDEIRKKYKNKVMAKMLYDEKKNDEWTEYMSIKRERLKKNMALDAKINKLSASQAQKDQEKSKRAQRKLEFAIKKEQQKHMKAQLGLKSGKSTQLDLYTNKFKELIAKLNEDKLLQAFQENQENKISNMDDNVHASTIEQLAQGQQNIQSFIENNKDPDFVKKQTLKMKVINESRNYYEGNLNVFSNGLSLMSINSLEAHSIVHQMHTQTAETNKILNNIQTHNQYMRNKTKGWVEELRVRVREM